MMKASISINPTKWIVLKPKVTKTFHSNLSLAGIFPRGPKGFALKGLRRGDVLLPCFFQSSFFMEI